MDIVLVNPQIPQNTGSIARTCAATDIPLHVINSNFEISDSRAKRAGLDYWPFVKLSIHECWDDYLPSKQKGKFWFFTKFAKISWFGKFC